jgi:F-type H+-transporting ATPase subunit delta
LIRTIAKRYANALVELSEMKKSVDKTKADLTAFVGAVDAQPAMQKLFSSPVFTVENKMSVIKEVSSKLGLQPLTQRFVEHLAETGRIRYVKEVHDAFLDILSERQNRAAVKLTTAVPVNNGDLADIKKKLEALTGKQVDLDSKVDAALIGGAKAQIGSVIYDGTIRNQLDKMRDQLMNK